MDFYKYELLRKCIDKIYNIHLLINEDDNDNNYDKYLDNYIYKEIKNNEYYYNRINNKKKIIIDGEYSLREKIFNYLLIKYDTDINYLFNILSI